MSPFQKSFLLRLQNFGCDLLKKAYKIRYILLAFLDCVSLEVLQFRDKSIFEKGSRKPFNNIYVCKGQIIIEVLIGAVFFTLVAAGVATILQPVTRSGNSYRNEAAASRYLEQEIEGLKSIAAASWLNIYQTSKCQANPYHVTFTTSGWTLDNGIETVNIAGNSYDLKFYFEYVGRSASTPYNITSTGCTPPGDVDTHFQKVTASIVSLGVFNTSTIAFYLSDATF